MDALLTELWDACGGTGELTVRVRRGDRDGRVTFPRPFAVVGRAGDCDLVLKDADVSRRHALLVVLGGRVWCVDLMSRRGTFWDGRPLSAEVIDAGTPAGVGPFQLSASAGGTGEACSPIVPLPPERDLLPGATLRFPHPPGREPSGPPPVWRLDRVLTFVGHASACKVRYPGGTVSRFHCCLLRTPRGLWAMDILGHDGMLVNGVRVRWARPADGDRLRVGKYEMEIRLSAPVGGSLVPAGRSRGGNPSALLSLVGGGPMSLAGPMALDAAAGEAGATGPVLLALVNQFSVMHQQMFDQFQQSMLMMLQMFGSLHREQFDVVRNELEELRRINQELHAVNADLARSRAPTGPAATAGPPATTPRAVPPAAANGSPVPPPAAPPAGAPVANGSADPTEVHSELMQRLIELNQDRQTRWQRVVGTLLGR